MESSCDIRSQELFFDKNINNQLRMKQTIEKIGVNQLISLLGVLVLSGVVKLEFNALDRAQ